jgi:hypothetical protein
MYQLKLGKFMKVRFLDGSGKKIEISGEIDKNFTIAQGQRITFAEGTKLVLSHLLELFSKSAGIQYFRRYEAISILKFSKA